MPSFPTPSFLFLSIFPKCMSRALASIGELPSGPRNPAGPSQLCDGRGDGLLPLPALSAPGPGLWCCGEAGTGPPVAPLWPCMDLRRPNLLGQTQVSVLPVAGGLELGARDGLQCLQSSPEKRKVELGLTPRSPGSPCSLTALQTPWPWGRSQQGRGAMARILEVGNRLSEMAVT